MKKMEKQAILHNFSATQVPSESTHAKVYQNKRLELPLESTLDEKQAGGGGGRSAKKNPKIAPTLSRRFRSYWILITRKPCSERSGATAWSLESGTPCARNSSRGK